MLKFQALVRLQDILQLRNIGKIGIRLIKFDAQNNTENYRIIWKSVQSSGERRVILDCDPRILKDVLLAAVDYGILDQFNVSILIQS